MPTTGDGAIPDRIADLGGDAGNDIGVIRAVRTRDPRSASVVDPANPLDAPLSDRVADHIGDLYTHQAEGLRELARGMNVCIATSTASGKTYVYGLQIAREHLARSDSTALLVFPTKALARDQEQELNSLYDALNLDISVRVYDGDTPSEQRRHIRDTADVIITNFVGLNLYLGHHPKWRRFYRHCRLVAIDESHTYTGVYGTHVAWTLRRLLRILDGYGRDPSLVCTSATIGNPADHAERLTGQPVSVVDGDGSPRGRRDIAFVQPSADPESLTHGRSNTDDPSGQSAISVASAWLHRLAAHERQTLLFARSRNGAERAANYFDGGARSGDGFEVEVEVDPYHAGLGKRLRRGVEHRLKTGVLDGVASTNALELGIDIGSVDATILTGFPGTRQSFWQQIGRAGRGDDTAISVFVARRDAIDHYLLDNPEYVLGGAVEDAVIGLENNHIFAEHVLAAADERPLTDSDRQWFAGERLDRAVQMWVEAGRLDGTLSRGVRYVGPPRPQAGISMFGGSDVQFEVRCRNGEIDMPPIDRTRAYRDHHEGALFLHDGTRYEVLALNEDVPTPHITVTPVGVEEYTQTDSTKTIRDIEAVESLDLENGFRVAWGTGTVEIRYTQYRRKSARSGDAVGPPRVTGVPPIELDTQLVWVETPETYPAAVRAAVADDRSEAETTPLEIVGGGLHGAEHGMIKLTPLELQMDPGDLGGLSTPHHTETDRPTWFVHETVEGGLGFGKRIFDRLWALAERTRDRVQHCDCQSSSGCPACIMDSQCGNRNRVLHTEATVFVLEQLLNSR